MKMPDYNVTSLALGAVIGAVFATVLVCVDVFPELTRLRGENARLRAAWKHCKRQNGPTVSALVQR